MLSRHYSGYYPPEESLKPAERCRLTGLKSYGHLTYQVLSTLKRLDETHHILDIGTDAVDFGGISRTGVDDRCWMRSKRT